MANEAASAGSVIPKGRALLLSLPLVVWALGAALGESLTQVGLYSSLLLVLVFGRRLTLAKDVKAYVVASAAFAGYQALSPALAMMLGTASRWPKSGRYGQFMDTAGGAIATLAAHVAAPWALLALATTAAWCFSVWVGVFQHFVSWPFGQPFWISTPVERVHENFATEGPPRYGAGGWLFHRLRFAHDAVAVLGPALAFAARRGRFQWVAIALAAHLLAAPYLGFTRAALGVAVLMALVAAAFALRGRIRLGALAGGAVLIGLVLASPAWRERLTRGVDNVAGGERTIAMTAGLELVRAHPLLGVGFGNHKPSSFATAERTGVTEYLATDSHDVFLTVWAETGLVGVLLWLAMHLSWLRAAWPRARAGDPWAVGGLLAWLGFQVLGVVHYLPYHSGVHLTFALVWGLALAPKDEAAALG